MEDLLKCPLCLNQFNLNEYKPLIAKCGHSFCRCCLSLSKGLKDSMCPLCFLPSAMTIKACISNTKLEQIIRLFNNEERQKPKIYVKPEEARGKSPGVIHKKRVIDKSSKFIKENNIKMHNDDDEALLHKQLMFEKDNYNTAPNQITNKVKSIIRSDTELKVDEKIIIGQNNNDFNENIELIALEQDHSIVNMSLSLRDEYPELFSNKNNYNPNIQISNKSNTNRNNSKGHSPSSKINSIITKEEALAQLKRELSTLIPSIQKRKPKEVQLTQAIEKAIFKDKYSSLLIKVLQPNEDMLIGYLDPNATQARSGVIYTSNGDYYEGDIFNDIKEGFGVYEYKGGSKYEGLFKGNQPHGYGKLRQQDGEIFTGEWKDGKINGNGIRYHSNGDRYIGTYINNIRNGNGHYLFANGDSYDGNWENGKTNGQGKFYFKNGNYYEGEFNDNLITGKGVFKILNGNTFIGSFKNGLINGIGSMKMINGDIYKGGFVNGKRQGNGIVYGSNGQIKRQGKWFNDKYYNKNSNHFE